MEIEIRVAGILSEQGKLLLVEHEKGAQDRYWVLPGGRVQRGESLREALSREYKEELGLDIEVGKLAFVNDFIRETRHVLNLYFEVCPASLPLRLKLSPDATLKAAELFPPDQLSQIPFRPAIVPELATYLKDGSVPATYLGPR